MQSSDEQLEEMDANHLEIRQVTQVKTPYHTWHPETQTKRNKVFIKLSKFDRQFVHFALRAPMDNTKGLHAIVFCFCLKCSIVNFRAWKVLLIAWVQSTVQNKGCCSCC